MRQASLGNELLLTSLLRKLLEQFRFFRELDEDVRALLPQATRFEVGKAGSWLIRQGDVPDCCYLIISGKVTTYYDGRVVDTGNTRNIADPSSVERTFLSSQSDWSDLQQMLAKPDKAEIANFDELPNEQCLSMKNQLSTVRDFPVEVASMETQALCSEVYGLLNKSDAYGPLKLTTATESNINLNVDGLTAVASIGPGHLVGKFAMDGEDLRTEAVVCEEDSVLLRIDKSKFYRTTYSGWSKMKDDKLIVLMSFLPLLRDLPSDVVKNAIDYFKEEVCTLKSIFFRQGDTTDGSLYLLSHGAVSLHVRDSDDTAESTGFRLHGLRPLRMLHPGSCFSAGVAGKLATATAVAARAPCKVFRVKGANLQYLPAALRQSLERLAHRSPEGQPLLQNKVMLHDVIEETSAIRESSDRPAVKLSGNRRHAKKLKQGSAKQLGGALSLPSLTPSRQPAEGLVGGSKKVRSAPSLPALPSAPFVELRKPVFRSVDTAIRGLLSAEDLAQVWELVGIHNKSPKGMWPPRRLAYSVSVRPDFERAKWKSLAFKLLSESFDVPQDNPDLVVAVMDAFKANSH